jgi:RNA polymerase sigma factor (sigma-70 family)
MTDEDALARAFERHRAALFRMAFVITGSAEEADDVVQDAFLRAGPMLAALPDDEVRPYLRAAVVNGWRSKVRREMRLREKLPKLLRPRSVPELDEREDMWRSVLALPVRQRACVVLRFYEDLPLDEIGLVLGCSTGTVKSQIHRALARLRKEHEDADRG